MNHKLGNILKNSKQQTQKNSKPPLQKLKEEYITKWLQSTNLEDVNERESIHKAIQLIPEIEKHLRIIVEKGKLTKTHINKIRNVL